MKEQRGDERLLEAIKVLYSPVKAFKKIAEKPDVKGVILILALTLLVSAGTQYVYYSKVFVETSLLDRTLIPTEGPPYNITEGFTNPDEPHNIKVATTNWTNGSDTITIYGTGGAGEELKEEVTIEENNTVYYINKPFKAVTKIVFSRGRDGRNQYVILVNKDDYASLLMYYSQSLLGTIMGTLTRFAFGCGVYTVFLWVVIKVSREEVYSWVALFIAVGYAFAANLVYNLLDITLISTFSTVKLPLEVWVAPTEQINQFYLEKGWFIVTQAYQWGSFLAFNAWIVALCAIAVHFLCELKWRKAAAISVVVYVAYALLRLFII